MVRFRLPELRFREPGNAKSWWYYDRKQRLRYSLGSIRCTPYPFERVKVHGVRSMSSGLLTTSLVKLLQRLSLITQDVGRKTHTTGSWTGLSPLSPFPENDTTPPTDRPSSVTGSRPICSWFAKAIHADGEEEVFRTPFGLPICVSEQ